MRNRYLVCYDIRDTKRLTRVHKKMCGYGDHLQYSVFMCDLNDGELIIMRSDIEDIMNLREDSLIIVNAGMAEKSEPRIITVGVTLNAKREASIVV